MSAKRRVLTGAAAVLLLLFTVACDLDTIEEVKADPYKYEQEEAHIGGIVRRQFAVLGYGLYEVEDQSGKIWVISRGGGVPSRGAKVEVKGHTRTAFSLSGVDYGTALEETDRKIHD